MKIEIGRKYRTICGNEVEILRCGVPMDFGHSVIGLVEIGTGRYQLCTWTDNGKWTPKGTDHSLNDLMSNNLVEVPPYDFFKIDDPVVVWDEGSYKVKGHFAGVDGEGKPMTFVAGQTSWSFRTKETSVWDHCIKAKDYKEP